MLLLYSLPSVLKFIDSDDENVDEEEGYWVKKNFQQYILDLFWDIHIFSNLF